MRKLTAPGWLVAFSILAGAPAGLAAQNDTGQPTGQEDNTAYGTTSAEFLLLGAGARGAALGGSFAAIASDISALYYNPAGAALIGYAGRKVRPADEKGGLGGLLGRRKAKGSAGGAGKAGGGLAVAVYVDKKRPLE